MNSNYFNNKHSTSYNFNIYEDRIDEQQLAGSRRNLYELSELITRLFELHSRLLVVRMDLLYHSDVSQNIPIEHAQRHREELLGDRREYPEMFEGMVGYAWGLESGEDTGYHYHFLFFYDGSRRQEDISIGLAIERLWKSITHDFGYCKISNFDKEKFANAGTLGIGMIHRDDIVTRTNLIERVAAYITKKCSAVDVRTGRTESGDFRRFGKSWMPRPLDPNVPRRGRPPANTTAL